MTVNFTCLCFCVDSLCCAGDAFVMNQRRAEHRLVLQLLGDCLNTSLKSTKMMEKSSTRITINLSSNHRRSAESVFKVSCSCKHLVVSIEVISWVIPSLKVKLHLVDKVNRRTTVLNMWRTLIMQQTYMSNHLSLHVRDRDWGETTVWVSKTNTSTQLKHIKPLNLWKLTNILHFVHT